MAQTLTAGVPLALEEDRSWQSSIIAVCDDISELRMHGQMAIMLQNGLVLAVARDPRWTVGRKVTIGQINIKRPGDAMTHKLLYPQLIPLSK